MHISRMINKNGCPNYMGALHKYGGMSVSDLK